MAGPWHTFPGPRAGFIRLPGCIHRQTPNTSPPWSRFPANHRVFCPGENLHHESSLSCPAPAPGAASRFWFWPRPALQRGSSWVSSSPQGRVTGGPSLRVCTCPFQGVGERPVSGFPPIAGSAHVPPRESGLCTDPQSSDKGRSSRGTRNYHRPCADPATHTHPAPRPTASLTQPLQRPPAQPPSSSPPPSHNLSCRLTPHPHRGSHPLQVKAKVLTLSRPHMPGLDSL